jgi:hypothetical protein
MTDDTIKSLIARTWKNEAADLAPGKHYIDEEFLVRVNGMVTKKPDDLAAPTVSIPLIAVLALFWEKAGVTRAHALAMLRDALREAMTADVKEDGRIKERIKDVDAAVKAIKKELIAGLPKMRRSGKLLVGDLDVEMVPVSEAAFVASESVGELMGV